MLAGVSMDYYVRLEQGRERNPSPQVLDALGAALRLNDDARQHLFRLAGWSPRPASPPSTELVDPHLRQLLDAWPHQPALVLGRAYDVLAINHLGDALFGELARPLNLLVAVFLDPAARRFYADWHLIARNTVAGFRLAHGAAPDDARVRVVLADTLRQSPEFAALWSEHDARGKTVDVKGFVHAEVGAITLRMQTFDVRSSPGQQLVVYHADPGSSSAEALSVLGSISMPVAAPSR